MNVRKSLPWILLLLLAVAAIALKRCQPATTNPSETTQASIPEKRFNRNAAELFFTKHARCRMQCRNITQQEVREILASGEINYKKSQLDDPKGATYALEGMTHDRQHVRIIFAPKQSHMSVVTVIDLDVEHQCNC